MLITFLRAIFLYIVVLIVMRLMGKREIGQMQPFELAISIMIADLAATPMAETGIPISNGIVPILGLLVMHLVISTLNIKSTKAREIICGKPSILIYRGKIDEKTLRKERFTINELEERLRDNNIFNIGDVDYAILETSGQVTVIPKPNKRNTTPEDFNIEPEYEGISYDLVVDGKVMYKNLEKIGKNYKWLERQSEKFGIKPEEALIITIDGNNNFFVNPYKIKIRGEKMYKETTICICIIILIIWLDILTQNYTKTSTIEITECLSELKKEIEDKSLENAKEKLRELDKKWDEKHDKLAYYIEHDELEKVDTAIVQVKSFVENEEIPSAIAELETGKFVLEHIERKYKFNLQNIF